VSQALPAADFEARIRGGLGRAVFALRWIMAPFYVGLLGALLMLAVKFVQKLLAAVPALLQQSTSDTMFTVLSLVDLSLVANLVVIVMFAGWENFIGRLMGKDHGDDLAWLAGMNFGDVKLRLLGSVMVIGAISILESFVHIEQTSKENILWELAILLGIGVTGVLLAVMDRLTEHR
jgi:uncharacterized protein (TIGR00645 family)